MFDQEVLRGSGPVLVDFSAEWRARCHAVAPVLERTTDEHSLKLVEGNVDEEQQPAERAGVLLSIARMILFENGEPKAQAIGDLREARAS